MKAIKTAGSNLAKFGSAAAGLVVGSFLMKKIPAVGPPIVQKVLPGTAGMVLAAILAGSSSNQHVKTGALGLGLAGFVDVVKKLTAGSTNPLLANVNSNLPALSGLGYVQDYGQYSPSYFSPANRIGRAMNGLGNADANAYKLEGADSNAFALEGTFGALMAN